MFIKDGLITIRTPKGEFLNDLFFQCIPYSRFPIKIERIYVSYRILNIEHTNLDIKNYTKTVLKNQGTVLRLRKFELNDFIMIIKKEVGKLSQPLFLSGDLVQKNLSDFTFPSFYPQFKRFGSTLHYLFNGICGFITFHRTIFLRI